MTEIQSKKIIISKPRVTEKTAGLSAKNIYTFNVTADANKSEIKKEIQRLYKVVPIKVNIAKTAPKKVFVRGRAGEKKGAKKAYVYLKDGDKISFI